MRDEEGKAQMEAAKREDGETERRDEGSGEGRGRDEG